MKKRIVCFGDSNTWGYDVETDARFPEDVRWTGRLQRLLGENYIIIEEGLCGRTTVFEDPIHEGMNGLTYLTPCLLSHAPVDYLIIMLGSNDCKEIFSATPKNIGDGMKHLIKKAQQTECWRNQAKILVIAPGAIEKGCEMSSYVGEMGRGCSEKSEKLAEYYAACAEELGCDFLDAGHYVKMNQIDFMHWDAESHRRLAGKLAEFFKESGEERGV